EGRTVLFVSHNMGIVRSLCRDALYLESGRVKRAGAAPDVVALYNEETSMASVLPVAERKDRAGAGGLRFQGFELLDDQGRPRGYAVTGEDAHFRVRIAGGGPGARPPAPIDVAIIIHDHLRNRLTTLASFFTAQSPEAYGDASAMICFVPRLPLLA